MADSETDTVAAPPPTYDDNLRAEVYTRLTSLMAQPQTAQNLLLITRLMAKWRSMLLLQEVLRRDGRVIKNGPFTGMVYGGIASEGSTATRLLGAYEATLAPIIEKIVRRGYGQILDVGCAEGYYAVGLALRLPQVRVMAHDADPLAREKCARLAQVNGVEGQITIGGEVTHSDFDICTTAKSLVICDIEGGEGALLDPSLAPGLRAADILVEVHDCFHPGLSASLTKRFEATHTVQMIQRGLAPEYLPEWMQSLSDLDRLLALWEWRTGPTPWLWMTRKGRGKDNQKD